MFGRKADTGYCSRIAARRIKNDLHLEIAEAGANSPMISHIPVNEELASVSVSTRQVAPVAWNYEVRGRRFTRKEWLGRLQCLEVTIMAPEESCVQGETLAYSIPIAKFQI